MHISNILVLCTGNICRSPIAELLLQESLKNESIKIRSAGTAALVGAPADPSSALVMRQYGFDLTGHRARQASPDLLHEADLILVLDRSHKAWIVATQPHLTGRVFKLGFWGKDSDVEDPYRKTLDAFENAYKQIQRHAMEWVEKLKPRLNA